MESVFSLSFLGAFLPLVVVCYQLMPGRHRWKVLLGFSLLFFLIVSKALLVFFAASSVSVYAAALLIEKNFESEKERLSNIPKDQKEQKKQLKGKMQTKRRWIVAAALLIVFGILAVLKYSGFLLATTSNCMKALGHSVSLPTVHFALPIGISFYTMTAASYLFDVYRKTIPADHNIFRVVLYLGFFAQLSEGPISRYQQTADSLWEGRPITWHNLTFGMQRILIGLIKELVVADRLNKMIATIFNNYTACDGGVIAVGMIGYTIQLYMDFSGAMDVVLGIGEIFDIRFPENFRQPFFSRTISEFWTRWHITLGTWFRDYLFYPVSMSKPLKKLTMASRKKLGNHFGPLVSGAIALFCVWICNGIWHGAGWNYIFFGLYHFILILTGSITEPFSRKLIAKLKIKSDTKSYHVMQIIRTVILVNIGELFFRADTLTKGFSMFARMVTGFTVKGISNGILLTLGMDMQDFAIVGVCVICVFAMDVMREKGICLRQKVAGFPVWVRWSVYYSLVMAAILFGAYGTGYLPLDPIYANF